jgi:phosphohistidine phosphatase
MNLILWRHADAEDLPGRLATSAADDLGRALTARGRKQAERCAVWLRKHLDTQTLIVVSPAVRAVQTAQALTDQYRIDPALAPGADALAVLASAGWPEGAARTVVVVGHQPALGRVASLLLAGEQADWSIKKSAIWWLSARRREDEAQVVLRAAINAEWL